MAMITHNCCALQKSEITKTTAKNKPKKNQQQQQKINKKRRNQKTNKHLKFR